ncbi:hypothetical protein ACFL0J_00050 [Candidatus Neomarinimicrobiota bacterium]
MKFTKTFLTIIVFSIIAKNATAQNFKPYILAATSDAPLAEISELVKTNLTELGLEVIGEYSPANDSDRKVFIITSAELKNGVKTIGGLTGFASALRVGLTVENDVINISYTNPIYWGNAYFGDNYDQVQSHYISVTEKISSALSSVGKSMDLPFGSKDGLSEKSLRKYRYMFGMEKFDDVVKLDEFDSFEDAVRTIDGNLVNSEYFIYTIEYPEQKLKLYGIAICGEKGEERFLPIIDISTPKHTAFLPYELLIIDKKAVMLHGRYRIALSFPDLTMMTFSKIMSTPGDIKEALKGYTQ